MKDRLKNSLSAAMLAEKLQARDAEHDKRTEELCHAKEDLESRLAAVMADHEKVLASRQEAFEILEKASREDGEKRTAEINRLEEQLKLISQAVLGEFSSLFSCWLRECLALT